MSRTLIVLSCVGVAAAVSSTCREIKNAYHTSECCGDNQSAATDYYIFNPSEDGYDDVCYANCTDTNISFPVPDVAEKNKVFDQLTVEEQLEIEGMMASYGVSFEAWGKCVTVNCSTIGKLALIKPPKSQVLSYLAGGPKPSRIASFWWLRADQRPRVAEFHTVEMPITSSSAPTLVRQVPWNQRPFISWEDTPLQKRNDMLDPLKPLFTTMIDQVVWSDSMLEKCAAAGVNCSAYVKWGGGAHNVPGSTPDIRMYYGRADLRSNIGPNYFKEGPMQYTCSYDWSTDTLEIFDIVFCPGAGNPVFNSVDEALAAYNDGTLNYCDIDGDFYGDTKAHMDPEGPYYIPDDMAERVGPEVYLPEGPRFAVDGRTVAWMGWDFHTDIHSLQGMHISNLRFKGERLAYEIYAADFTAIYSGASTRKDIFYSDGGYEMGNCATTLRAGLQCSRDAVFLYSLGYDRSYVWGNALSTEDNKPTQCIFEAPENEALFQHARDKYEGLPATSLYVRNVLTVGNYDYTQTFKISEDGSFHFAKQLSGYAVGGYVMPGEEHTTKMADYFGAMISKSSYGVLHTHSAVTKVDLDISGLENSFKIKRPAYGQLSDLLTDTGIDTSGIAYQSPGSFYFSTEKITSEGNWDNDGDDTWTAPAACLSASSTAKYIVESPVTTAVGNNRSFEIQVPASPEQMLPEHNKFLHLQNFTKCDIAVTAYNTADEYAVSPSVFGNLYPLPAISGHDISHFFDDESLEKTDLVFYIHNTKFHYPRTEDVPVPTTMGKAISFEPYNFNMDDVGTFKHLPKTMYRYNQRIGRSSSMREGIPVETCAN